MVGEFNILIAAITTTNNEALVTRDKHFKLLLALLNFSNGELQKENHKKLNPNNFSLSLPYDSKKPICRVREIGFTNFSLRNLGVSFGAH